MKRMVTSGLAALTLLSLVLSSKPASAADDVAGWQPLFNGTDLTGWVPVNDARFSVTNGNLRVNKSMGWLRTEKEYGDFVLELEWRALEPAYNSGVFVRCGAEGKPFPDNGWQVNLKESGLGGLMRGSQSVVASTTPPRPLNQWFRFRIEVRGKQVTLDVDGQRAWTFDNLDRERGYIGLQAEGKAFDFRNLRVQELPAAGAAQLWQNLFNGKDLSGWVPVHDVTFKAADGNLQLVKGMGWLRTEKEYTDFDLELEWRALVPQYDSGVFFRCSPDGKPWPTDGWQVNLRADALGALVRGYKTIAPAESPRMPTNQWVKLRCEVRGKQAVLFLNDEKQWQFDALDRASGFIGIQAENKAFDFRNVRLREVPSAGGK